MLMVSEERFREGETGLGKVLFAALENRQDTTCIASLSRSYSVADVLSHAREWSRVLNDMFPMGDDRRVAIWAKNSPEYVLALLGILAQGAIPFLIDPSLASADIAKLAETCGLDVVITDVAEPGAWACAPGVESGGLRAFQVRASLAPGRDRPDLAEGTALCRFTSGSTRGPACIQFSARAVVGAARTWAEASRLSDTDRILCFAGVYNGLAFNTSIIPALLVGSALYIPGGLPSRGNVRRHMAELRPTVLVGFPALYDQLAAHAGWIDDDNALRLALSSAAPLEDGTRKTLAQRDRVVVSDYYGVAEVGPITFKDPSDEAPGLGIALAGVHILLPPDSEVDSEIEVRTGSMGIGYLNYPGVFESRLTPDGYYRTGDTGRLVGGRVVLGARSGRGLNVGGRKVSAEEIEVVLLGYPGVEASLVLMAPNPAGFEVLSAAIEGDLDVDRLDLRRHCLANLPAYKVPDQFLPIVVLPRGGAGKISSDRVRQLFETTSRTTQSKGARA